MSANTNILINCSNSPSSTWEEKKLKSWDVVIDVQFPYVDPRCNIRELFHQMWDVLTCTIQCAKERFDDEVSLHIDGEQCLSFAIISAALAKGIKCYSATYEDDVRINYRHFVAWRQITLEHLPEPAVGTYVKPDGWKVGSRLIESDGFSDSSFPGCDFRLPSNGGDLAVNVEPIAPHRVKIEFVGDGEPSTFCEGVYGVEGDCMESTIDHEGKKWVLMGYCGDKRLVRSLDDKEVKLI